MADHADDTILDDELDENEFNFDNEHEDALLAENEYDYLEKAKSTIKDLKEDDIEVPKTEEEKIEPLEVEEDVLDIGIVDEDIVDQDTAYLQEDSLRNPVQETTTGSNHNNNGNDEVVCPTELKGAIIESAKSGLDELEEGVVPPASGGDEETQNDQSILKDGIDNHDEKISKPSVISLRKLFKKSYDDVPDLAKVIESVQPGSASSRVRKNKRAAETYDRKRREGADGGHSKHDYEEKKRKEPPSYLHDHAENHDRKYDRDRHRDYERDRERDYDRDRSRDYDRGRPNYREDSSLTENRSQVVPYHGPNETSEAVSFKYQQQFTQVAMQPEQKFQSNFPSGPVQYQQDRPIIASVQITQQRYDYVIRPGGPLPQVVNQPPPVNAFGPPTNQRSFFRGPAMAQPFPDTMRPPPHPNVGMQSFPRQQHMNMRPPPPQGFRPPMHQMNQQPPPNPQSYMPGRGPPLHMQPPPARPQLQSPQMVRQLGPPPQMRPQFRPPSINLRPQQMRPPMEHIRPDVRPAGGRFPGPNERLPPSSIMGRPPPQLMHMPPPRNHFPADNGVRMGTPFRPNVPPPQNVPRPQAPPPAPAQYYDGRRHVIAPTAPPSSYQQTVSQTYVTGGPAGQPTAGGQNIGNTYSNVQTNMEVNYSQYPQADYYPKQPSQQYSDDQYANKEDVNPLKRNKSPMDVSPSKLGRYDYLDKRKDEDDELKRYRVKVEEQKKLREQLVQQKEEQRLKNQMQNFIQSNIKGILEKREQFRRKNELETAKHSRESTRKPEPAPTESSRRVDAYAYSSSEYRGRRSASPVRSSENTQRSKDVSVRDKDISVRERLRPPVIRNEAPPRMNTQRVERTVKKADSDFEADRGQLHKVLKITYKDGTVALKSIPVQGNNAITKSNTNLIRKSHSSGNFEIRIGDDDSGHPNRRRMVVSKEIPVPNVKNELAENIIVESVRKAVPRSSIPLAQRFSNLRTTNKDEDDESVSAAKSKNRLVIPDEDKVRTVLVKNIAPGTNPALIQKMANTCGSGSHINWIYGGGHAPNQARITFSKLEEAKKFCSNFHRKMIDVSMITVSMLSDTR